MTECKKCKCEKSVKSGNGKNYQDQKKVCLVLESANFSFIIL